MTFDKIYQIQMSVGDGCWDAYSGDNQTSYYECHERRIAITTLHTLRRDNPNIKFRLCEFNLTNTDVDDITIGCEEPIETD